MIPEIITTDPTWPHSKAKTTVLAAASAVIREDGPRAATLKNIATKAGITEPAIFRHFDGVDGLFGGLFGVYERIHERSASAFDAEGKGVTKLHAASLVLIADIAASRDFAYLILHARHVFRGYPDFKAKIAANEAKDQTRFLACVNEGIKAGDIRSDIDPVSAAASLIGGIRGTAEMWVESGFGFDLTATYADRWDDFERMVSTKSAPKSREVKAAVRERATAYFPLRPAPVVKTRGGSAKKAPVAPKAAAKRKTSAGAKSSKAAFKKAPSARTTTKKPSVKS
jgi:AcrR family transcriptional regulator